MPNINRQAKTVTAEKTSGVRKVIRAAPVSYTHLKRKLDLEKTQEIKVLTLKDMYDTDEKNYGLNGSATQVERIFPPESNVEKTTYELSLIHI